MSKPEGKGAVTPSSSAHLGLFLLNNIADVPRDLLPSVRRCLKSFEPYAPRWLRSVRVMFVTVPDEGEAEYVLQFVGEYEYERATLKVFAQWLDYDEQRRRESFVHEFGHALTEPMRDALCTAIDVLAPHGDSAKAEVRALLIANVKRVQETVAEDIKHAILAAERKGKR